MDDRLQLPISGFFRRDSIDVCERQIVYQSKLKISLKHKMIAT